MGPQRFFFVVSTGRSGTTTIARLLTQAPNCLCLHEPEPQFVREAPLYHYGEIDGATVAEMLRETRSKKNVPIYGESSHKLSFLMPVLHEVFPDAKFVWLIRDGRDVVASSLKRQLYYPVEKKMQEQPDLSAHLLDWTRYRLDGTRDGTLSPGRWASMSLFEKNCWRWARINEIIGEHVERLNLECRRIRLEEIESDVRRLALWLGVAEPLTGFKVRRHNASQGGRKSWHEWTHEERRTFEAWCGRAMNEHYPGWRANSGAWQTLSYNRAEPFSAGKHVQRLRLQMDAYFWKIYDRVNQLVR